LKEWVKFDKLLIINIYLKVKFQLIKDDLTNSTVVWSRQTSQGNTWRYAQTQISEPGNFRLVIEGIVRIFLVYRIFVNNKK
jgi:hypothetical protein